MCAQKPHSGLGGCVPAHLILGRSVPPRIIGLPFRALTATPCSAHLSHRPRAERDIEHHHDPAPTAPNATPIVRQNA